MNHLTYASTRCKNTVIKINKKLIVSEKHTKTYILIEQKKKLKNKLNCETLDLLLF